MSKHANATETIGGTYDDPAYWRSAYLQAVEERDQWKVECQRRAAATEHDSDNIGAAVALIERMADAVGTCSEMLNGRDQMLDALAGGEGPCTKSPLTALVDDALGAWRTWRFNGPGAVVSVPTQPSDHENMR